MTKKCDKCGALIEGFLSKIKSLFGMKNFDKNPDRGNKCDVTSVEKNEKNIIESPTVDLMEKPADNILVKPEDEVMKKPNDDLIKK